MSAEKLILTRANPWRKVRAVSSTREGLYDLVPQAAEPSGDDGTATGRSIIDLTDPLVGGQSQNMMEVILYQESSEDFSSTAWIAGWSCLTTDRSSSVTSQTNLWIPVMLAELAVTCGTTTGVSGKAVTSNDLFDDTIGLGGNTANLDQNIVIISPENNTIARVLIDLEGYQKIEFLFSTNSFANNCNALYRTF